MDRSLPSGRPRVAALTLFLGLALALAACGSGSGAASFAPAPAATSGGQGAAPGGNGGPDAGGGEGENGGNGSGGNGNGSANGLGSSGGAGTGAFRDLARIVYTGTMSVRVEALDPAVASGREAVLDAGGYIGASRQSNDGVTATASITYRIPADRWEETVEALRSLGTVIDEAIASEEVTGQLVDLEARLRNLRIQEASVQKIAEEAVGFEEILEGQARLAEIRGQIEQIDAQRASLEDKADLGTLTVTFGTEVKAVELAADEAAWDARGEVARATGTLVGVLQALTTAGIWLGIVWLPVLVMLGIVALATRVLLRRIGVLGRIEQEFARPPVSQG
jgi:Domain of unknown function (DUF4349)